MAARKVKTLIAAGALVTVISPRVTEGLARLFSTGRIRRVSAPFSPSMLKGFFIVVAATDDRAVNDAVSRAAGRRGMPVNVVDDPALSSFIVPSLVARNGLIISISTSGKAPCLARKMRLELERSFVPKYARRLVSVARERARLKASEPDIAKRKKILTRLVNTGSGICRD